MKHILLCWMIVFSFYSTSKSQMKEDSVVASIKSHNITITQFEQRYINFLVATGMKDNYPARKSVLNNMINEIMLYYYDDNEDVFKSEEYKKELEWTRKQAVISYLKDQEVYAKLIADEKELREAFVKSNEEIAARHLYAPTYEEAQNLYQLLQIGISFDSLAKQTFTDSALQNNGGYLGYFKWGDMDPAFEDAVFSMKVGEISEPVKTDYGYSIIQVEDRYTNPLLTENEFQNQKSSLDRTIKIRKKVPAEREYVSKIFNKEKVFYNNECLIDVLNLFLGRYLTNDENKFQTDQQKNCVEYEGQIYSQNEIVNRLRELPSYHFEKLTSIEKIKEAIEGLLVQERLLEIANSKGYDKSPYVIDAFKQLSTNLFMNYKREDVVGKWDIPDSLVVNYYNDNIHLFSTPQQINVQEIIVGDKQLADSLYSLLQNSGNFELLAKKYSLREWSANNGGILGLAPLSKFGIFKYILWNTSIGEVVGPFQIEDLYGIFKVLEKMESAPIELPLIKNEVKSMAKRERKNSVFIDYVEELRTKSDIYIDIQTLSNHKVDLISF